MSRLVGRVPFFRPIARLGISGTRPSLSLVSLRNPPILTRNRVLRTSLAWKRLYTTSQTPPPSSSSSSSETQLPPNSSFTQRLKFLIKRYGAYAIVLYLFFGTIDLALTFGTIYYLGADYVSKGTEKIIAVMPSLPSIFSKSKGDEEKSSEKPKAQSGKHDLFAMFVLAYTIHKTIFLPFRVGMTAAYTPRFVNWLSARGWVGTQGARRAAQEMRAKMQRAPSQEAVKSRS